MLRQRIIAMDQPHLAGRHELGREGGQRIQVEFTARRALVVGINLERNRSSGRTRLLEIFRGGGRGGSLLFGNFFNWRGRLGRKEQGRYEKEKIAHHSHYATESLPMSPPPHSASRPRLFNINAYDRCRAARPHCKAAERRN